MTAFSGSKSRPPLRPGSAPSSLEEKFRFDREVSGRGCVVGIDEAGRGPWAGPVVAAAVSFPPEADRDLLVGLNDSKQLSERRREDLAAVIRCEAFAVGIGSASAREIDRLNIEKATFLAMKRALLDAGLVPDLVLVDGHRDPGLGLPTQCVVKGDSASASIAAASILAKTDRDRRMVLLGGDADPYGFARHKGYGTEFHRRALAVFGVGEEHRRSFKPIAARFFETSHPSEEFLVLWDRLHQDAEPLEWEEIRVAIAAAASHLETNEVWLLSSRFEDLEAVRNPASTPWNLRKKGAFHEEAVLGYLAKKGYSILEKNYQTRMGEIDLIARDGETLVFVEVKMRTGKGFGSAAQAVDSRKRKRMIQAARAFLAGLPEDRDSRFDVIALDGAEGSGAGTRLRHFENAFALSDEERW